MEGTADDAGRALVNDVFVADDCLLEWGAATSHSSDGTIYRYKSTLTLRFDEDASDDQADLQARQRLHNLGYPSTQPLIRSVAEFQRDYGLTVADWPDDDTKKALWATHVGGVEATLPSDPPDAGVAPDFEPLVAAQPPEHLEDWAGRLRKPDYLDTEDDA
jgi:hypothetical protein